MQLERWCGVRQGHCLRCEALPVAAGAAAPVTPAPWEEGETSTIRMGGGRNVHD